MDFKIYADRVKFKTLPSDFNHQDGDKFNSSWEYAKTLSNYHFDKFKDEKEGEWFHLLGRFVGDWNDDVKQIVEKSKELDWEDITKSGLRPGFKNGSSPMAAQEEYDREIRGLKDVEYTNVVLEEYIDQFPKIKQMIDIWGLENVSYRCHVQRPGQFFAPHIDKLWHRCPADPSRIVRLIVHLADYEPGQFIMYGNTVHTKWQAGDVHIFDTLNVPHATANLSTDPRPNLTITGLRTEITDQLLKSADKNSTYVIQ
jgi:hypothetical protein